MQIITAQNTQQCWCEGSTNFISRTDNRIRPLLMFVFILSGWQLIWFTNTYGVPIFSGMQSSKFKICMRSRSLTYFYRLAILEIINKSNSLCLAILNLLDCIPKKIKQIFKRDLSQLTCFIKPDFCL